MGPGLTDEAKELTDELVDAKKPGQAQSCGYFNPGFDS
jgi:hypothetical protein